MLYFVAILAAMKDLNQRATIKLCVKKELIKVLVELMLVFVC